MVDPKEVDYMDGLTCLDVVTIDVASRLYRIIHVVLACGQHFFRDLHGIFSNSKAIDKKLSIPIIS